ncbi:RNA-directed DNA polymerase, eukaryota, reverse transcriptase zinc-binding domain protein [Tanacetum coccineum]
MKTNTLSMCGEDDLLVLCLGDSHSANVVKSALDNFNEVSRLQPNMSKSTILYGNATEQTQQDILSLLPFKVGKLLISYLVVKDIDKLLKGSYGVKGRCLGEKLSNDLKDEIEWITSDGKRVKFFVNRSWKDWKTSDTTVPWSDIVWFSHYTPKHSFILRLAILGRMATQDRIMIWHNGNPLTCPLYIIEQMARTNSRPLPDFEEYAVSTSADTPYMKPWSTFSTSKIGYQYVVFTSANTAYSCPNFTKASMTGISNTPYPEDLIRRTQRRLMNILEYYIREAHTKLSNTPY